MARPSILTGLLTGLLTEGRRLAHHIARGHDVANDRVDGGAARLGLLSAIAAVAVALSWYAVGSRHDISRLLDPNPTFVLQESVIFGTYAAIPIGGIAVALFAGGESRRSLGLRRCPKVAVVAFVATLTLMFVQHLMLFELLEKPAQTAIIEARSQGWLGWLALRFDPAKADHTKLLVGHLVGLVLGPLSEELLYRVVVLTALWRLRGPWSAILGSSALFSAAHALVYGQPWLVETFVLSVACGVLCVHYRSWWPALFAHWGANAGVLAAEAVILTR